MEASGTEREKVALGIHFMLNICIQPDFIE
jgi:hypothetical protein